jgi:hypothetical protein
MNKQFQGSKKKGRKKEFAEREAKRADKRSYAERTVALLKEKELICRDSD